MITSKKSLDFFHFVPTIENEAAIVKLKGRNFLHFLTLTKPLI